MKELDRNGFSKKITMETSKNFLNWKNEKFFFHMMIRKYIMLAIWVEFGIERIVNGLQNMNIKEDIR